MFIEIKICPNHIIAFVLQTRCQKSVFDENVMTARLEDESYNRSKIVIANHKTVENGVLSRITNTDIRDLYRKMSFADRTFRDNTVDCRVSFCENVLVDY